MRHSSVPSFPFISFLRREVGTQLASLPTSSIRIASVTTMTKKSSAQIKRNMKRAESRGEVYNPPPEEENKKPSTPSVDIAQDLALAARGKVALQLQKALKALEEDQDLKAKERRSEKRKAMAIASQESGVPADELMEWFAGEGTTKLEVSTKKDEPSEDARKSIPYIAFVGQLSFTTTKDMLFDHIQTALASEKIRVTPDTIIIRLLTDAKTKKSRGMAFVQVFDPEVLYALLKLHHTMLDNRRINVERSTGGGKEIKKEKVDQFRKEQQAFMLSQVQQIIQEYISRKEVAEGELDDTAVLVCTRHSPVIVQAALDAYVEKNGREMDNPSAYFTFLITKIAEEGVARTKTPYERSHKSTEHQKRPRDASPAGQSINSLRQASSFAKSNIDMSASEPRTDLQLSTIFPSSKRGRGRGR